MLEIGAWNADQSLLRQGFKNIDGRDKAKLNCRWRPALSPLRPAQLGVPTQ
jgi:hypothetical protein